MNMGPSAGISMDHWPNCETRNRRFQSFVLWKQIVLPTSAPCTIESDQATFYINWTELCPSYNYFFMATHGTIFSIQLTQRQYKKYVLILCVLTWAAIFFISGTLFVTRRYNASNEVGLKKLFVMMRWLFGFDFSRVYELNVP